MSPRTDLCDTCQHFRDGLHYNACQEEEAKDLLKRFKEHLSKAKLERNYYYKNTKLAGADSRNHPMFREKSKRQHLFNLDDILPQYNFFRFYNYHD